MNIIVVTIKTIFLLFAAEWLCYDDHNVGKITGDKVQCSEAYVLFYRRRDMTSSP